MTGAAGVRPRPGVRVALVAGVLLVAGCSVDGQAAPAGPATPRSGLKTTCPEATVTPPPGLVLADRELVPFSRTLLGVHTTYEAAGGGRLEVLSGGYVDDLTEDYDDLRVVATRPVDGQSTAVLQGSLLATTARLVVWRRPGTAAPCDVHAVVATDLSDADFTAAVDSVAVAPAP